MKKVKKDAIGKDARLLIATSNPGKIREYSIIFSKFLNLKIKIVSLQDIGLYQNIEENGKNYEENAMLKAKYFAQISNLPTLADDSGLEIDYLNGWPGLHSHRLDNGKDGSDKELIERVLERLKGVPFDKRTAYYKTVVAIAFPGEESVGTFSGERKGFIVEKIEKKINWEGFPYDALFYVPEKKKVFVELGVEEKARLSHRFVAIEKALSKIKEYFSL